MGIRASILKHARNKILSHLHSLINIFHRIEIIGIILYSA